MTSDLYDFVIISVMLVECTQELIHQVKELDIEDNIQKEITQQSGESCFDSTTQG